MATATEQAIQQIYIGLLGRSADPEGLAYWAAEIDGGTLTLEQLRANIVNEQPEYAAGLGLLTRAQTVEALYQNLFERAADAEGLEYWVNGGGSTVNTDQLVLALINGAAAADTLVLDNKTEAAIYYTENTAQDDFTTDAATASVDDVDNTSESVDASKTATDNGSQSAGQTFTLTKGSDTVTGTSAADTIVADTGTFNTFDVIDGGAGTDTLSITEEGATIDVSALTSVANVEVANLRSDNAVTADTTGWTGLTNLNLTAAAGAVSLTVNDDVAVSVDNAIAGGATVATTGGSTVSVSKTSNTGANNMTFTGGDATTSVTLNDVTTAAGEIAIVDASTNTNTITAVSLTKVTDGADNVVALTDVDALTSLSLTNMTDGVTLGGVTAGTRALTLNLDGFSDGDIVDGEATSLVVNSSGAGAGNDKDGKFNADAEISAAKATSITINATDTAAELDLDLDVVTSLTVTGDVAVGITPTDIDTLETVTVSGSAGVMTDLSSAGVTSLDMSGTSGDNTIVDFDGTTAEFVIKGGSGADNVTTSGALDADAVVTLGDGDDTFAIDTAAAAGASVDAGAGNDTLGLTNGTLADTAAEAGVFSNFETLEIGGGQGTYELDLLGLTDIKISSDVAAAATLNDAAAGATITSTATASTDLDITAAAVTYVLADASGSEDALTVNLNAVDGDDDGTTTEGEVTIGELIADDIEKVTIASNATALDEDDADTANTDESTTANQYINTISVLNGDAIATLELTGNAQAVVTVGADDGGALTINNTAVTLVDASGNTAGVTVDMSAVDDDAAGNANVAVNTTAVTFKGSDAADTYSASHNGDIIQGNGGADTINLSDNADQETGVITLDVPTNANETVRYAAISDSQLTLTDTSDPLDGAANEATGFDRIVEFKTAGTDIIELSSSLGLATGDARADVLQKGLITGGDDDLTDGGTGAAALETFIGDGADFFDTGLVDRAVAIANNGTDTFVFIDGNSDGNFTQADDMMVVMTGVVTLAVTDFSFG